MTSAGIAIASSFSRPPVEPLGVARGNDDVGAFALGHSAVDKTDAGGATDDDDFLACKQHAFPLDNCDCTIRPADSACRCRLALPEAGQFPDAGAGRIDVGGDIDVDQIGLVGGDALADRLGEIAGAVDAHAFDAAGARHRGEIRIVALRRSSGSWKSVASSRPSR